MELSRSTMKRLIFLILFAALAFTACQWMDSARQLLGFLGGVFAPFFLGAAIAFILNVPMRFIEAHLFPPRRGRSKQSALPRSLARAISLVLTFAAVVAVLMALVLVVIPQLADTIVGLGETVQSFVLRLLDQAEALFANNPDILQYLQNLSIDWRNIDWESVLSRVVSFLKTGAGGFLTSTISVAKGLVSAVATFFIALIFSCYVLLQKEKLALQCRKAIHALLPRRAATETIRICSLSQRIFSSFITGQCLESVILGTMFFVVMSILRMPYALLVGCLIAVTALIPIVGAFIGCAVGAFLLLMVSPLQALIFVVMFLILQQVEGNLIYPHVVGSSVGLPSIWVLVAVTVGGNLCGVVGMLVFIPLVSVAYTLFRELVYDRLREKGLRIR